jgi:hypothetical protein
LSRIQTNAYNSMQGLLRIKRRQGDPRLTMDATTHRPAWKTLLAFAIIYFVWGSTFLAIRVGVREVPPFLLAAIRFLIAALVLYGWTTA